MERGSKLAIHKLKLVEPKNGQPFYKAIVFEKVYNSKKTIGGNWETAFYDAYIFNMELELEEADRSLGVNEKDKFSFDNIANKDKSVIRVIDTLGFAIAMLCNISDMYANSTLSDFKNFCLTGVL